MVGEIKLVELVLLSLGAMIMTFCRGEGGFARGSTGKRRGGWRMIALKIAGSDPENSAMLDH